ncbi:MAG: BspA family leucine-rich repeat surface protein, partial [Roseivirga sp.]|nr:BspA family leucine-rich repeat surface protein [Roseivirga sp.]
FLGEANPELTISYSGFENGDTKADITEPTIATTATESSPVGTYDITLSGGAAANYNINLVNGQLTVEQRPFIITLDAQYSISREIEVFGVIEGLMYDYTVDWGDGNIDTNLTEAAKHTYTSAGPFTVKVTGNYPGLQLKYFNIKSIEQWGSQEWESLENALQNRELTINATDAPDLSQGPSMAGMFRSTRIGSPDLTAWDVSLITNMSDIFNGSDFNGNVSNWNVSNVTDMSGAFGSTPFNGDISTWNVGNVTTMRSMFIQATDFNGDLSNWDVSSVTNMESVFNNADSFNGDISSWDVSSVTDMTGMFSEADLFNQDISSWDVSNVVDMAAMFSGTKAFNQPIDAWDVSSVVTMEIMFRNADAFNQELNSWDVSKVEKFDEMFKQTALFNGDITGWDVSSGQDFEEMFQETEAFNQPIGNWNLASATRVRRMFRDAEVFNQPINNWRFPNLESLEQMFWGALVFNQDLNDWDVSNIINMASTFEEAESFNGNISNWDVSKVEDFDEFMNETPFNQDISGWNVSNAKDFGRMFEDSPNFNQDLSNWDMSKATDVAYMFESASSFDQDISSWQLTSVTSFGSMLKNSGLSVENYDAFLISISEQELITDVQFDVEGLQYCAGAAARQSLIDNFNWTIENDSQACSATVTIADVSANEDDGAITVTLTSDAFVVGGFTVDISTSNGTAEAGMDYTAVTSETITFAGTVGETQSFTITPTADSSVESDETLTVSMSNLVTDASNTVTITDEATITILNDDVPVVSFNTTAESNAESVSTASIEVMLSQAGLVASTVDYTVSGTATGGVDYTLANGTLSFAAGELSKRIDLTIVDDALIEENETVVITLSNASGASLGTNTVYTYTIVNNDAQVTIEDVSQFEDGESFLVTATLEGTIEGGFTVDLSTADGTATVVDGDYTAVSGTTLTFIGTDGEVQKLDIAPGVDSKLEADETFTVSLSNLSGTTANVVITDQAVLTIKNDDAAAVTLADASGNEGDGAITVTATLDNAVQGGFTVEVNTADGTATLADSDYTAVAGKTLTFAGTAGETQTFTVTPTNDLVIEANETLTVSMSKLSTALGVDISDGATVTIVNDDFNNAPTDIAISTTSIAENNALNAAIGTLTTADADAGNTHTYALVSGAGDTDNASFTVDGSTLKANNTSFNFEDKASYSVRIETNDGAGGTFAKAFEITVSNVNEAPFTLSLTNATIDEADEAQEVGQLMSLDPDNGDTFTYSLMAGDGDADNAQFAISGNTLSTAGAIDFEDGASRSIRVQVADAGGLTFEQTFSITIEDVVAEPVREYTQNQPGADVKNVFSPNGDGINETWVIEDLLDNPFNQVKIFAQGGKLIYSKVNYSNDWAGTFKDNPVPDGTYYYEILIFENEQSTSPARTIKGFLTIIRNR